MRAHPSVGWRVNPVIAGDLTSIGGAADAGIRSASPATLPIPFLNTSASTDLILWWLLLPVWWVAGVEQMAALPLLLTCARSHRGQLPPAFRLFLLFIAAYVVSGAFIIEPIRYVTFARGLSAYVGAFAVGLAAYLASQRESRAESVLAALVVAMTVSALMSVAAVYGVWRPEFTSVIAELVPGPWTDTGYGSAIAARSLGQESWFLGMPFYRAKGLFLFATMSATAMAATLPLTAYGVLKATSLWRKAAFATSGAALTGALVASTGRMAAIGLGIGALVTVAGLLVKRRWTRTAFAAGAVVFSVAAVQYIGPANVWNVADQFIYARGGGSVTSRTDVYRATLTGVRERPVFGWGTERDVDGLAYPAGSHSYYLGVAYKHGLIGLSLMVALFWRIWKDSSPHSAIGRRRALLICMRWSFIAVAVNALTDAPDLDAVTLQAGWMIAGVALGLAGRGDGLAIPARMTRPLAYATRCERTEILPNSV